MANFAKFSEIFILIFFNLIEFSTCFNVNFYESYDAKVEPFNTQIYKRELSRFFDEASYSFNGFEKIESIPVLFPLDICILDLEGSKYATALHKNRNGVRHFAVFKMNKGTYELMTDIPTPIAITMDCKAMGAKGYVAIAFNITKPIVNAQEGSPIFEIAGNRIRAVQYFAAPNLEEVYLRVTGNDFFLLQTFTNTRSTPNLNCPYFRWSGSSFNKLGRIPCSNARHLEPFSIDYESYVAVANYADQRGRTETFSEIYKYVRETKKFQLLQKIRTNGAVDVQYFSVPFDVVKRQHFLIFGNSISTVSLESTDKHKRESKNREADSVFYLFDRGQFVPYQRLSFYAVEQFLPVQNTISEKFLLLVACKNQDIKIYNLNDWKFEESKTQFTEGALSRGVTNMRIFQENDNSYLVIANELMTDNDTNIFLPIFKQDEHANVLRQQIIDWAKTNIERLSKIDVEKLKQNVEQKMSKQLKHSTKLEVNDIPSSNIQTVITKSLDFPPLHLTTNYWKALSYANQALDALQNQFAARQLQKREVRESNTFMNMEYDFEKVTVGTLLVRDKLRTKFVNGIQAAKPEFESLTARRVIVTNTYKTPKEEALERLEPEFETEAQADEVEISDVVNVENLYVTGKLNEFTWDNLLNNTLKRSGLQFVKSSAVIDDLTTESVVVTNDEISAQNLGKLISINTGNFVVNQDIQFAAPVIAKNVVINERLNNIHVFQRKFDVLLKRSNVTQVVQGPKRLDNVKVLEPVTIAGQIMGKHLQSMSPNKAIHSNVILNGDYVITGDVIISKMLRTNNLIDVSSQSSVKDVLQNGLSLDETIDDVNIKFMKPLQVNNSLISFVNTQDLQKLLQTNVDWIQVVEGEKSFTNNLEIRRGFSEVKQLNGVDVEKLEQRLLLKHTNQTIKSPMHFGKIVTKGLHALNLKLDNKNISAYLTSSGDQQIQGALKVQNLIAENLQLENLNTNGKIFNEHLNEIYQQKANSAPSSEIFHKNRKFHGSIYVRNLQLNSTINNRTVKEIEQQLTQLDGNIKYVGNIKFNYDMNITELTFHGQFNGISASDFGSCWLQKLGDQNFTAPQTLAVVQCERGVSLVGKLNSYRMDDFFSKAVWINRNEHLSDAIFQNPIHMQGALITNTINTIRVPQDLLYRNSPQPQILYENAVVQHDLHVKGSILNTTSVNGLNLVEFERYLSGYDNAETLHLEQANFAQAPYYHTLNKHDLKHTLDAVWLANENVDLQHHVEIAEAYFEGLLELEGPINNMNLQYLKDNYFSLSRPQVIGAEMVFANTVKFEKEFRTGEMHLFGPVTDSKSNSSFDFTEFVSNTLKTAGPHEISGNWSILEAIVPGDLQNVQVNKLNFVQDVLRADAPLTEITATKRINSAAIKKLYVTPSSKINEVGVAGWIRDAVYVYGNQTIRGVTTLDTVNLYNDLRAERVNNGSFDESTLLLSDRNQLLQGDVHVHNNFPESQSILALNFENLQMDAVNGAGVPQFFANQVKLSPATRVFGRLTFTQPLVVQEYHGKDGVLQDVKWKRGSAEERHDDSIEQRWQLLQSTAQNLRKSMEVRRFVLDHFEIRQTLSISATKIVPLTLRVQDSFLDIIGILNEAEDNLLRFYRWEPKSQQFVSDQSE